MELPVQLLQVQVNVLHLALHLHQRLDAAARRADGCRSGGCIAAFFALRNLGRGALQHEVLAALGRSAVARPRPARGVRCACLRLRALRTGVGAASERRRVRGGSRGNLFAAQGVAALGGDKAALDLLCAAELLEVGPASVPVAENEVVAAQPRRTVSSSKSARDCGRSRLQALSRLTRERVAENLSVAAGRLGAVGIGRAAHNRVFRGLVLEACATGKVSANKVAAGLLRAVRHGNPALQSVGTGLELPSGVTRKAWVVAKDLLVAAFGVSAVRRCCAACDRRCVGYLLRLRWTHNAFVAAEGVAALGAGAVRDRSSTHNGCLGSFVDVTDPTGVQRAQRLTTRRIGAINKNARPTHSGCCSCDLLKVRRTGKRSVAAHSITALCVAAVACSFAAHNCATACLACVASTARVLGAQRFAAESGIARCCISAAH
eukprot:Rhum_TRINITY_DN14614_c7_g1::Rhum_TRINITY_DN14614_c7_g1_i3::g.104271::m.104271